MVEVDLLIKNIKELVNPAHDRVVRGKDLNSIRVSRDVWLGSTGEAISFIGFEEDFNKNFRLSKDAVIIDGSGFVAIPGFVDPHTHLPFAGTRQDEFRQKLQGVSYQEIAERGGGIKGSVKRTREISLSELVKQSEWRLDRMLLSGTTTMEAKSGYGLNKDTEIKQLEVIKALDSFHPVDIVPTFLGAHEIPEEYRGRNLEFLKYLVNEVVPQVRDEELAEFGDIFCEEGYFSYDESEFYLEELKKNGFKLKVHADEFTSNNAAILAVNKGAVSAEHLIEMTPEEIEIISGSNTASVFLPGVSFFLKMEKYAPIREVIKQNGIVALGSDFNPGSSMVSSMLFIFHLGIFKMGLTIEEALNTVTINSAYSINREESTGSIELGKKMDILLLDIPDYSYLGYHLGVDPVNTVIKSGEIVVKSRNLTFK
ncbi:MAG: imidazolonepropionase [Acidobacteriota bacterium]